MRLSLLVALATTLILPSFAQAAEVGLNGDGQLVITDPAGQRNVINVNLQGENVYGISDSEADLTISSSSEMQCVYSSEPDHHFVNCTKQSGQVAKISFVTLGAGDDLFTVAGPIASDSSAGIYGEEGNDTLQGSDEVFDQLIGGAGDDVVVGNGGADNLYGGPGTDKLYAKDGVVDLIVECDDGTADDSPGDEAFADANDPVHNCTVADGGGGDGGGGTGGGEGEGEGDFVDNAKTVRVPNAKPKKTGKNKFAFTELDDLRDDLRKLGVPVRLTKKGVGLRSIRPLAYIDAGIENGDVISQGGKHLPGRRVQVADACFEGTGLPCRIEIEVKYYDESKDLAGENCPYRDNEKTKDRDEKKELQQILRGLTYTDAVTILNANDCRFRIIKYQESSTHQDEGILRAIVSRDKTRRSRPFFVDLTVRRPARSDFTVSIGPRPYDDYKNNSNRVDDFENELDLGKDGKLTYSTKNKGVVHVMINENFSGRFVKNVKIELVKNPAGRGQDAASVLGSSETDNAAAVTFTVPVDWTGDLQVNARVRAKRNSDDLVEEAMQGWITIPVIERPANKPIVTQSGRYFRQKNGRWERVDLFVEAMKAFSDALKDLNKWPASIDGACETALKDPNTQRAINNCWKNDVAIMKTSSGGTTVGDGRADTVSAPGYVVADGGLIDARIPASVVPGNKAVIGAGIISDKGSGLMASGIPLLNLSSNAIINENGLNVVSDAGAGLLGKVKGVTLISNKGGGIISDKGAGLISDKGVGIISDKSGGLLPITGLVGPDGGT